jgi:uncharacterized protein YkwD
MMKTHLAIALAFTLTACAAPNTQRAQSAPTAKPASQASAQTLLGQARGAKGLSNLSANSRLQKAAEGHSKDMAAMGKLSHNGSNGSSSRDRSKAQGYNGCVFAENIANTRRGLEAAFEIWMNSAGHRANIQNARVKEYGLANSGNYWTLALAGPC